MVDPRCVATPLSRRGAKSHLGHRHHHGDNGEGKLYLCIIKDLYDGVVVAWRTSVHPNAELVTRTVDRAVQVRLEGERPVVDSDRGSQYTSRAHRKCLEDHRLQISMGQVASSSDCASAETVFGQLNREIVHGTRFQTRQEAAEQIDRYFLRVYNPLRRTALTRAELTQGASLNYEGKEEPIEFNPLL
ncbi:MAG: transposase [Gammaproteobacteria bacterium]|nr:transposase [Gammaproteobacteria bacterium]